MVSSFCAPTPSRAHTQCNPDWYFDLCTRCPWETWQFTTITPQPFSEVSRYYSGGTIFTGNTNVLSTQPKALRVDYIGASTNAADPTYNVMYVALEDTAGHVGVYLNDPSAQLVTAWTQWYIPLTDPNFSRGERGSNKRFPPRLWWSWPLSAQQSSGHRQRRQRDV